MHRRWGAAAGGYPGGMDLGPSEVLLIFLVVMLLFGAKKLPELARGTGRALRIFKAEVNAATDPAVQAAGDPGDAPDERSGQHPAPEQRA